MANVAGNGNGNGNGAVTIYQTKSVMADNGAKIVDAFVANYDRRQTIDKLQAEYDKSQNSAVALASLTISKLIAADKRILPLIEVFAREPKAGEMENTLNSLRFALGWGTVVKAANGHLRFEYSAEMKKRAVGTGEEKKDSPEAKRATTIAKNLGQLLKEAGRANLGAIALKAKLETDAAGTLKLTATGQAKSIFGTDATGSIPIGGTGTKALKEGKKKPTISVLAEYGSGKSRSATTASKTPNQVTGQTGASPVTSDPNEAIGSIANSLIEALNRSKGMGALNSQTIAILAKVRDAVIAVLPTELHKADSPVAQSAEAKRSVTVNSKK